MAEVVEQEKEATFAESLALEHMFRVTGKDGIFMVSGKPIKNGKWVRVGKLFNESSTNHLMVKTIDCKSLTEFRLPKMGKDDPKGGVPSEAYSLEQLIDNIHIWKKGKEFTGKGFGPAFYKKVCPKSPTDMVYKSSLKKLVSYYNYFVLHINKITK